MKSISGDKTYTSSMRKLVRFFEKSRDHWKTKCRNAKVKVKRLTNRVRFLEESRAHWKKRAQELAAELAVEKAACQKLEQAAARQPPPPPSMSVLPSSAPAAFW